MPKRHAGASRSPSPARSSRSSKRVKISPRLTVHRYTKTGGKRKPLPKTKSPRRVFSSRAELETHVQERKNQRAAACQRQMCSKQPKLTDRATLDMWLDAQELALTLAKPGSPEAKQIRSQTAFALGCAEAGRYCASSPFAGMTTLQ